MVTGQCSCGAVRFEVSGEFTGVAFCHCSRCRRWHGHVGAYAGVARSAVRFTERRGLRWWAASATVKRGFCGECGSSLLWDEEGDARLFVCPGALDAPTGLKPRAHIYVGSKGDYYELGEDGVERKVEFAR